MAQSAKLSGILLAIIATILLAWVALPSAARAQESSAELNATIRSALLSDPRTAGLSDAQVDAMVSLLTQEAQKRGVTSRDIQWRPQQNGTTESAPVGDDYCGATPAFLCAFSLAFGFAGTNPTIPFILGAASMALIWILAEMLHRRRYPAAVPASAPSAAA